MTKSNLRVLIAESHPLYRGSLEAVITNTFSDAMIDQTSTLAETLQLLSGGERFDLIVLDISLRHLACFEGLIRIKKQAMDMPIAVISAFEYPHLALGALNLGAAGFIPKTVSSDGLAQILSKIVRGETYKPDLLQNVERGLFEKTRLAKVTAAMRNLTKRQFEILQNLRLGKSNKLIAKELGLCEATVKAHVSDVLDKLGAISRTHVVALMKELEFTQILASEGDRLEEVRAEVI